MIAQLKDIINDNNARLTIDERNLLSIAYKNLTANLRASWRTIDALQKKEALSSTRQQVKLMRVQKDEIERDLDKLCRDVVNLLETHLIPAARDGEEKVFYSKMYVMRSQMPRSVRTGPNMPSGEATTIGTLPS